MLIGMSRRGSSHKNRSFRRVTVDEQDQQAAASTLGRLFAYLRPFWLFLGLAALCLLVSSLSTLVLPWVLQHLLDGVFVHSDQQLLNQMALLLLSIFALRMLFDFGQTYLISYVSERLVATLRQQLYAHTQRLPLAFFHTRRVGDLMSLFTTDVTVVESGLTTTLLSLLQQLVTLIGSVIIIAFLDWHLTLIITLIVPFVVLSAAFFGRRLRRSSRSVQEKLGAVSTILEETLSSVRVVKSFARERYEIGRFQQSVESTFAQAMNLAWVRAFFVPLMSFLAFAGVVVVIWFGGQEVLAGSISPGQLVSFVMYMVLIASPIASLSNTYTQTQASLGAAERLFELLDTAPERADSPTAIPLTHLAGQVVFEHVSFHYTPEVAVLKDLSLAIPAGKTVALVGPSGAGKTTITGLILRLYEPNTGHIFIDGYDISDIQIHSLREQIAIVPQEPTLFGGTIRQNIAYGRLGASLAEIVSAAEAANASEFIERLPQGYETVVGERGVKLSAGQRQRIVIARAVLRDPRILILDEATASLDNEAEALVQEALSRLMRKRTTLVIAHRLTTVEEADQILVLENGQIREQGCHEELLAHHGLYRRLYKRQFNGELA
jgi:ATP-binding cassette, subfamily B, bacterial MsbA